MALPSIKSILQRIFGMLAIGDIQVRSVCADGFTQLVANDGGAAKEHVDVAIGPHNAILNVARSSFGEKLRVASPHKLAVVGMYGLSVILERRTLATVVAEKEAQVLARVEDFACYQIVFPTTGMTKGFGLPQNPLAPSKFFLRLLAIFDID